MDLDSDSERDDFAYFTGVPDVLTNQHYAYYLPNPAPTGALDRILAQQRRFEERQETKFQYMYQHPTLRQRSTVFSTWRVQNRQTRMVGQGTTRRVAQDLVIDFHIVDRLGQAPIYKAMTVVLPGYPRVGKSPRSCTATINDASAFSGVLVTENWQSQSKIECTYSMPDGSASFVEPQVNIAIPGLYRQFKISIYKHIAGTTESAARIFGEWYRNTAQFKMMAAARGLQWPDLRLRMT